LSEQIQEVALTEEEKDTILSHLSIEASRVSEEGGRRIGGQ
jgi:hypothetical protein